jgi:hypothetical protein
MKTCLYKVSSIIAIIVVSLSCCRNETPQYDRNILLGKWKYDGGFVNGIPLPDPADFGISDTVEFTESGKYYLYGTSDSVIYQFELINDEIKLYADSLIQTLDILKLDHEYLWTFHIDKKPHPDSTINIEVEYHYIKIAK